MENEIDSLKAHIRHNEQTARAMRERSAISLKEAEDRDAENVELKKKLVALEKKPKA